MNAIELGNKQQEIWNMMEKLSKELENGNRLPIYDGVCDLDGYLSSKPKIMWILKEPNGQTEKGIEKGGWVACPYVGTAKKKERERDRATRERGTGELGERPNLKGR